MIIDNIYKSSAGRFLVLALQKAGAFKMASCFLKTGMSGKLIPRYIRKHEIDMNGFEGQEYLSFADFFSRKRKNTAFEYDPKVLMSPCDGLLSMHQITDDMIIEMKSSYYRMIDLIPNRTVTDNFAGGICMVFRLQASDYHHFCAFDDSEISEAHYVPGELHSVQPIACEKVPVYRLNRRWWSVLETENFGTAAQIEVGAMMVGDVSFAKGKGYHNRGEEMGNFELGGSTIVIMLNADVKENLLLYLKYKDAYSGLNEIPVKMGEGIGIMTHFYESV